jgi:hypothetical protein
MMNPRSSPSRCHRESATATRISGAASARSNQLTSIVPPPGAPCAAMAIVDTNIDISPVIHPPSSPCR